MHMGRFVRFMAIEIEAVRARSENGRHVAILLELTGTREHALSSLPADLLGFAGRSCAPGKAVYNGAVFSDPWHLTERHPMGLGRFFRCGVCRSRHSEDEGLGGNARASRVWKGDRTCREKRGCGSASAQLQTRSWAFWFSVRTQAFR